MKYVDKGYGFKLLYPSVDYFINKIDIGDNFKYIRFNHGALDAFALVYQNIENFKKNLDNKEFDVITNRLKNEYRPFIDWHGGKNLHKQIEIFVDLLCNLDYPNLHAAIDAGIGMGGGVGVFSDNHPTQIKRIKAANYILEGKDIDIYHTGLPKHWAIMGEIPYLIEELEKRNIKIILMGAPYMKYLIQKLNTNVTHIEIPYRKANEVFYEKVQELKSEIIEGNTIIFHSTGHLLSTVLLHHLRDIDVNTFDIGRGFDWLLHNEPTKVPHYKDGWLNYFGGQTEEKYKTFVNKLRNESRSI